MSYRNSSDESPEETEIMRDVFVTVMVYRPFCLSSIDQCTQSRQLVVTQQLIILGSQNLTMLRDAIKCPQDKVFFCFFNNNNAFILLIKENGKLSLGYIFNLR